MIRWSGYHRSPDRSWIKTEPWVLAANPFEVMYSNWQRKQVESLSSVGSNPIMTIGGAMVVVVILLIILILAFVGACNIVT